MLEVLVQELIMHHTQVQLPTLAHPLRPLLDPVSERTVRFFLPAATAHTLTDMLCRQAQLFYAEVGPEPLYR